MKTTVSVIKADIGSVSGHCVAHPELMDICDEVLNEALEAGIIKDYYISRCGDDIDLIMIDYVQLMSSGSNKKDQNRQNEVSDISRNLKITAKELNVPIIALSQLSRGVESRPDHRPMLADLRDSGAIEQDADIVLFLYNPEKYNDAPQEDEQGRGHRALP